jgi:hypothetical protein
MAGRVLRRLPTGAMGRRNLPVRGLGIALRVSRFPICQHREFRGYYPPFFMAIYETPGRNL